MIVLVAYDRQQTRGIPALLGYSTQFRSPHSGLLSKISITARASPNLLCSRPTDAIVSSLVPKPNRNPTNTVCVQGKDVLLFIGNTV